MCGIAGMWGSRPLTDAAATSCLEAIRHRGPDDQGRKAFESLNGHYLTMLFARLRIIDLDDRANQPMNSGGVWVTLNGEIFNYREIRELLKSRGVQFRTASDTEVLLEGYREFGWEILDRLEGMWAFALYDERSGCLSLCRDRFGEKPLFFSRTRHGLVYASEMNALNHLVDSRPVPNIDQIRSFLIYGYKSLYKNRDTFFQGVAEVAAGTLMHVNDDGTIRTESYWTPRLSVDEDMNFSQAVVGVRDHLSRSLEIRLRSDVPLAFSLSGGVDSVALASLARRELGVDVRGFTILNSDPRYEEKRLVEEVVRELSIQHTGIELKSSGFWERLHAMVVHRAAPVLTISHYIQSFMMEQISQSGFKVIIGGNGADEIFTGYFDHHLLYIASLDPAQRGEAIKAWETTTKPFVRNPFLQDPLRFVVEPNFRDHIYLDAELFASYTRVSITESFTEAFLHPVTLRNRMLNELFHESVPVLLHEEDLNAMTFSIENRSPYLDRNLMEFTSSIPSRLLVRNGRAKAVLRESVRGIAPDVVLDNPRKVGFNAPIEDLINLRDPAVRAFLLADSPIYEVVRRDAISNMLEVEGLRNSQSKFLFSFFGSKFFLEEYG